MWANNFDPRLWGRCSRGERLISHVPQGEWKTITFVAALRSSVATCKGSRGPGGNVTGVFTRTELAAKKIELLKEMFRERTRVTAFWDSLSTALASLS